MNSFKKESLLFKGLVKAIIYAALLLYPTILAATGPEVVLRNPVHKTFGSLGLGQSITTSGSLIGVTWWVDDSILLYDLADHTSKTISFPGYPSEHWRIKFWNNCLVSSSFDRFYILDCLTGTVISSIPVPQLSPTGRPQIVSMEIENNNLFLGLHYLNINGPPDEMRMGSVVCYDLLTLNMKWKLDLPNQMSPLSELQSFGKKQLVCLTSDRRTYNAVIIFINKKTGRLIRTIGNVDSKTHLPDAVGALTSVKNHLFAGATGAGSYDIFGDAVDCGGLLQFSSKGKLKKSLYEAHAFVGCLQFGAELASDDKYLYVGRPTGSGTVKVIEWKTLIEVETISPPPGTKRFGGVIHRTQTHLLVRGVENGESDGDAVLYVYRR